MIKINQLSERVHSIMVKRFGIGRHSSVKAWIIKLSRLWVEADKSIHEKECSRFVYSQLELVLADMMLLIIALLHHLGVKNIENLLRRRLDENDRENEMKVKMMK